MLILPYMAQIRQSRPGFCLGFQGGFLKTRRLEERKKYEKIRRRETKCAPPSSSRCQANMAPIRQTLVLAFRENSLKLRTTKQSAAAKPSAYPLSLRCIHGDIRIWVGDPSTSSCLVSLPSESSPLRVPAVERTWHTQDSQCHI